MFYKTNLGSFCKNAALIFGERRFPILFYKENILIHTNYIEILVELPISGYPGLKRSILQSCMYMSVFLYTQLLKENDDLIDFQKHSQQT